MHRAVHRLHRRVREKWHLIGRLDFRDRTRHGAVAIADGLRDRAFAKRCPFQIVEDILSAELRIGSIVPFDDQGGEALLRRAHMIGHDRDCVIQS